MILLRCDLISVGLVIGIFSLGVIVRVNMMRRSLSSSDGVGGKRGDRGVCGSGRG